MGWQDVIGSMLTAGATGDPMAFSRHKLEQAYKQFQMQKMTEDLEMRKEMHEVEKRKADFSIKHLQTLMEQEEQDRQPLGQRFDLQSLTQTVGNKNVGMAGGEEYAVPTGSPTEQVQKQPTMEDFVNAIFTKGSSKDVKNIGIPLMEQQSKAQDRLEKDKDRAEGREDRLAMFGLTLADKQAARDQNEQIRRDALAQNERHHQDNLALRETLGKMTLGLRTRLPANKVKEISDKKTEIEKYTKLADEFVDKFGGDIAFGPLKTSVYEVTGLKKDRVNWWKRFRELDVRLRHDLFGATLTTGEQKAWDLVTINENTNPAIIKEQLKIRSNIAANALQRDLESYEEAGYTVDKLKGSSKNNDPLGIR